MHKRVITLTSKHGFLAVKRTASYVDKGNEDTVLSNMKTFLL